MTHVYRDGPEIPAGSPEEQPGNGDLQFNMTGGQPSAVQDPAAPPQTDRHHVFTSPSQPRFPDNTTGQGIATQPRPRTLEDSLTDLGQRQLSRRRLIKWGGGTLVGAAVVGGGAWLLTNDNDGAYTPPAQPNTSPTKEFEPPRWTRPNVPYPDSEVKQRGRIDLTKKFEENPGLTRPDGSPIMISGREIYLPYLYATNAPGHEVAYNGVSYSAEDAVIMFEQYIAALVSMGMKHPDRAYVMSELTDQPNVVKYINDLTEAFHINFANQESPELTMMIIYDTADNPVECKWMMVNGLQSVRPVKGRSWARGLLLGESGTWNDADGMSIRPSESWYFNFVHFEYKVVPLNDGTPGSGTMKLVDCGGRLDNPPR